MLSFDEITLNDRQRVQAYTLGSGCRNCDFAFSNLFSWRFLYRTRLAEWGGFLLVKFYIEGAPVYMMPVGEGDLRGALEVLAADAHSEGHGLRLMGVCPNMREGLEQLMPGAWQFAVDRDYSDYLYLRTDLANLTGKRYQSKRNHINRFVHTYPDYEYRDLTTALVPECLDLAVRWCRLAEADGRERQELEDELRSLTDALHHFDALGLQGGVLYVEGRIVAFTFGTAVNYDTFDVCVEKADVSIEGSYAMINREFARRIPEQYIFLNREEDLGLEGLRKAKLSYHPHFLLEKHTAVPQPKEA